MRKILLALFDHLVLEESFSCKNVQLKKVLPSVKTICSPAENM